MLSNVCLNENTFKKFVWIHKALYTNILKDTKLIKSNVEIIRLSFN